jgi:hypothetical protein
MKSVIMIFAAVFMCVFTILACGGKKGEAKPQTAAAAASGAQGLEETTQGEEEKGQGEQAENAPEAQAESPEQAKPGKKVDVDKEQWGDLFMARKFTGRKDLGPLADQVPKGFSFAKRMLVAAKDPNWWLNPANTKPLKLEIVEVSKGGPVNTKLPPEKISEGPTFQIAKKKMVINLVSVTIENPEGCGKKGAVRSGEKEGASASSGESLPGAVVITLYAVPHFKGLVEIKRTEITKTCPGH